MNNHSPSPPDETPVEPWLVAPWVLCVNSGAQQGARQPISAGRTLIGNDLECDLVLSVASTPPLRALLSLVDDSWAVTSMAGELRVDSRIVEPGCTQPFEPGEVVSIGGVDLSVERQGPAATTETTAGDATRAADPLPEPAPKSRAAALPLALALLAAAALVGAAWPDADSRKLAARGQPMARADVEELQQLLRALGFGGLRAASGSSGPAVIEGWLASELDLRRLQQLLLLKRLSARLQVHTLENLVAAGRDAAGASGAEARIEADGDAALRVHVPRTDIAVLRRLTTRLMADVPGLARLRVFAAGAAEPAITITRAASGRLQTVEAWVLPLDAVFDATHRLAAVESQPVPSVLLADGRRIFEGGALDDHIRIEHIGPDALSLSMHDVSQVTVPLR